MNGLMHSSKTHLYSITSSTRDPFAFLRSRNAELGQRNQILNWRACQFSLDRSLTPLPG
jgi:hypothetical protein